MTASEAPGTAAAAEPRKWRRVIVATCASCGWLVSKRDYRSDRYRNRKAFKKAAEHHTAESGHDQVAVFVEHA